jgi:PEP-CTERM motif
MKLKMFSAAILLAIGAPVMAAECTGDGSSLGVIGAAPTSFASQCGRLPFGSASFTDHYSFSIAALGNVAGGFVDFLVFQWNDVNLNSVVVTGQGQVRSDSNAADGFSFAGLSAGTYDLAVSGYLDRGQLIGGYTGAISSSATVAAPVPEPETYAMLMLGLAGVGFAARRRNKS